MEGGGVGVLGWGGVGAGDVVDGTGDDDDDYAGEDASDAGDVGEDVGGDVGESAGEDAADDGTGGDGG